MSRRAWLVPGDGELGRGWGGIGDAGKDGADLEDVMAEGERRGGEGGAAGLVGTAVDPALEARAGTGERKRNVGVRSWVVPTPLPRSFVCGVAGGSAKGGSGGKSRSGGVVIGGEYFFFFFFFFFFGAIDRPRVGGRGRVCASGVDGADFEGVAGFGERAGVFLAAVGAARERVGVESAFEAGFGGGDRVVGEGGRGGFRRVRRLSVDRRVGDRGRRCARPGRRVVARVRCRPR